MPTISNTPLAEAARPHNVEDSYPLSPIQQGMVFHSIYDRHSGVEIEQMIYTLHEDLNVPEFMLAWQRVIDRHPILRTSFRWEGLREPVQEVNQSASASWDEQDLRSLSTDEQHARLSAYLESDRRRGFDLRDNTLNRFALLRVGQCDYQFIWTFHHAIIDGRSFVIVLKEAFAFYEARSNANELKFDEPRAFRDYIEWQRQRDTGRAENFWRGELEGFRSPTPLVVTRSDQNAIDDEPAYTEQEIKLTASLTSNLKSLASAHQVTLNNMVQSAWALLLSRYSGETDVVFGATRACRRSAIAGAETIVGPLINTLPMRLAIDEEMRLIDWLKQIRAKHIALREYEHDPLMKIQEWSEVSNGRSLFDSLLVFENYELDTFLKAQGGRWEHREFKLLEQTNYPLALSAWAGPELLLKLAYDRRNFDDDAIERMLGHVKTLLEGMAQNPDARLAWLPMLTDCEQRQLLFDWTDGHRKYFKDVCIHQLFEAQVNRTPEAPAVIFEGEKLSYRELNAKANQLARHLQASGVGRESLVGICMERSLEMVVAVLAILKAGGAYVPLDPAYPKERLASVLSDARPGVLLTQHRHLDRLPAHHAHVISIDRDWELIARQSEDNPDVQVVPENLAYVIYTSGSTGTPKGVMIEHRSLVNFSESAATDYEIKPADRVLQFASINFDASAEEIYPCLTRGAALVLRNDLMLASISAFLEKCQEWGITILDLPTAYWHGLVERLNDSEVELPESLRLMIIGGERAMPERLSIWAKRVGSRVRLVNTYGPTEATIVATSYDLTHSGCEIREAPIGRAINNTRTYILDRRLRPVPIGVPGELHIQGAGVARGYLNKPDITSQKFIVNPFDGDRLYKSGDQARYLSDGNIAFCGRFDDQVKIHGYRIELGEIESAATGCPAIRGLVVMAREDTPGDKRLVAYMVPASGGNQADVAQEVRDFLRRKLPAQMLPSVFIALDEFPINRNGKIDRQSLPAPDHERTDMSGAYVKPRDPLECQLAQIWEELFDIRPIGIRDNFFDLGGHSLLSVRMMDRIEQVLGKQLPLATLFSGATIENLAKVLLKQKAESARSSLIRVQAGGAKKPFFYLHGDFNGGGLYCLSLARHLGSDQPFYALQPHGMDDESMPETIEEMAKYHLKTLRNFQPEGPYLLGGHCNGGLIAFEMARQLEAAGAKVELLVMICAAATNARYRQLQDLVNRFCLLRGLGISEAQNYFLNLRDRAIRLEQAKNRYTARFAELFRLSEREQIRLARDKGLKRLKTFAASFSYRKQFPEPSTAKRPDTPAEDARRQKLADVYVKAMTSYVPRRYAGRVTLFWPDESPFGKSDDPTWGWRDVAAETDVHTVMGGHLTCITKHASETAQVLKQCIDAVVKC
ncbi:MAG: amino acid adenylation domain-containing protein [Blastocatellia bacterium]